ncbi:hypothetical protein BZA05DRAFT_225331 [Tricharina praecox]|uniref:uncharacterized protein n=1 Tax=Tricharina praecox TaxID=43433 RepID=UPI00221EED8F|nr:uncharacterized protein BZA05DRAFT_225331 [Tricharina praecox]KAI5856053.1 hypothetical protein BZA05DRAFT_225331 [Tricharina praecox]
MTMSIDVLTMLADSYIDEYQSFCEKVQDPPTDELARVIVYSDEELGYEMLLLILLLFPPEFADTEHSALIRHLVPAFRTPSSLLKTLQSWTVQFSAAQQTHPHLYTTYHNLLTSLTTLSEEYVHFTKSISLAISHLHPLCATFISRVRRTPTIHKALRIGCALWRSLATSFTKAKMNLYAAHMQALLQLNADGLTRIEIGAIYVMLVPITLVMRMMCLEGDAFRDILVVMGCVRYVGRRAERIRKLREWCHERVFDDGFVEVEVRQKVKVKVETETETEMSDELPVPSSTTTPETKAPAEATITTTATEESSKKKKKKKKKSKRGFVEVEVKEQVEVETETEMSDELPIPSTTTLETKAPAEDTIPATEESSKKKKKKKKNKRGFVEVKEKVEVEVKEEVEVKTEVDKSDELPIPSTTTPETKAPAEATITATEGSSKKKKNKRKSKKQASPPPPDDGEAATVDDKNEDEDEDEAVNVEGTQPLEHGNERVDDKDEDKDEVVNIEGTQTPKHGNGCVDGDLNV